MVKRALAGDQAAYAVLVQKYSNGLHHHIKATVRSEPNAGDQVLDDLVQELSLIHISEPTRPY